MTTGQCMISGVFSSIEWIEVSFFNCLSECTQHCNCTCGYFIFVLRTCTWRRSSVTLPRARTDVAEPICIWQTNIAIFLSANTSKYQKSVEMRTLLPVRVNPLVVRRKNPKKEMRPVHEEQKRKREGISTKLTSKINSNTIIRTGVIENAPYEDVKDSTGAAVRVGIVVARTGIPIGVSNNVVFAIGMYVTQKSARDDGDGIHIMGDVSQMSVSVDIVCKSLIPNSRLSKRDRSERD